MREFNFRGRFTLQALGLAQAWEADGEGVREIGRRLNHSASNVQNRLDRVRGLPSHEVEAAFQRPPRGPRPLPSKAAKDIAQRRKKVCELARQPGPGHHPHKFPSANSIARECTRLGIKCSATTVRSDLKAMGFVARKRQKAQKLYPSDPATRLHFCKTVALNADYQFCDEKIFDRNDHSCQYEWCEDQQDPSVMERERWSPKVHVWGMIGIGVKELVVLPEGSINAAKYKLHVLQRVVVPTLTRLKAAGRNPVFVQDGARPHTAHANINYLVSKLINILRNWPPRSPDLNPIENLWAHIQRLVSERGPSDTEELKKFVVDVWNKIPQSVIDDYVRSFAGRVKECRARKGQHLKR